MWTIAGRGAAGPSNPQSVGFATAFRNLDLAIDAALAEAGLKADRLAAACGALAGAERDADRRQVERWAEERGLASRLRFVHDAEPLLAAGTPAGHGVAVIAGTGSFVFGQNESGDSARAGGWGYLLGDEGSGYAIALAALQAAARTADGCGPATRLLDRWVQKFDLARPLDLIGAIYQSGVDRPTIAGWADLVLAEADAGDAVAGRIVAGAASELAETIAAVCRKIGFGPAGFPLAFGGGLVVHHGSYQARIADALKKRGLIPGPIGVVSEPVRGAVILAQRLVEEAERPARAE